MARRIRILLLGLLFAISAVGSAQPPGRLPFPPGAVPQFPQSPEPPLADGAPPPVAEGIQQAGAQLRSPAFGLATPVVTVNVRAPAAVMHGKEITYRVQVDNASAHPAFEVNVSFPVPKGAKVVKSEPKATESPTELTWQLGKLDGGARKELTVVLQPPADAADLTAIAKVRFEHGQQVKTKLARPELAVKRIIPATAQQHDTLNCRLEVRNPGFLEVSEVKATDTLPEGLVHQYDGPKSSDVKSDPRIRSWPIGRLGPGEVRLLDYRVVAERAGQHSLVAQAEGTGGARGEAKSQLTVAEPKLELLAGGPGQRNAHQQAVYRFTVRNYGPSMLRNVLVCSQFTKGCKVERVSEGGRVIGDEVQWVIPVLAANDSRTTELTLRYPSGGEVTQQVTATYRGVKQQTSITTRFESTAELKWDVKASAATAEVGGEVKYTITVHNEGTAPATNVRAGMTLPEALTFVAADPPGHGRDGQRVTFQPLTLSSGQKQAFNVATRAVRPGVAAQVIAELAADAYPAGPLRKQESITVTAGGQTTSQGK